MNVLALFNTAGFIFGPAMFLAGLVALVLCWRATRRADSTEARRTALLGSLMPLAVGTCGTLVGLALWWSSGQPAGDPETAWIALGKVSLAGFVVTVIPLLWSLTLYRTRGRIA